MTIEIKKALTDTVLEITGRLDTTTAPALDKTIRENIAESCSLVLDLKGLEYISSAGLRVLLGTQKRMQRAGSMRLKNVCEEIMEVFDMTGFSGILVIEA